jgi:predicted TIM-barrel fold metal-dependent hydrolase
MFDFTTIDSDGHVREPKGLWETYLPPALRDRAPRYLDRPFIIVDGVEMPPRRTFSGAIPDNLSPTEDRFRFAEEANYSAASQLQAMDIEGITAAVLFPTTGLLLMGVDGVDPALTTAMAHAYNTWLADFVSDGEGRLFGVACIDVRDIDGAITEARRAVEDLGFLAIFLRPNPVNCRPWYHDDYDALWATLQDLDAPVCFHEGAAVRLPQVAIDRFDRHVYWHCCTHPMEQQMAMVAMFLGGVAQRYPRLRMAFLESGAGWLPYWLWRLDEAVERERDDLPPLDLMPSEYFERQGFITIDTDEAPGILTIDHLHVPHVAWGSDYPHFDTKFPQAIKTLAALPGMTSEKLRQVLHDAPMGLFGTRLAVKVASIASI